MRRRRTDISLWDYARLKHELLSRPRKVLLYFQRCQIATLVEVAMYREIVRDQPDSARRIEREAAMMGIPIRPTPDPLPKREGEI